MRVTAQNNHVRISGSGSQKSEFCYLSGDFDVQAKLISNDLLDRTLTVFGVKKAGAKSHFCHFKIELSLFHLHVKCTCTHIFVHVNVGIKIKYISAMICKKLLLRHDICIYKI